MKAASDCTAYAPWRRVKMAENNVEPEHEWSDRALDTAEDTLVAMETLLATLRAFEDVLRQQDISTASSTEYCDNFCQVMCTCNIETSVSLTLAQKGLFFSQPASWTATADGLAAYPDSFNAGVALGSICTRRVFLCVYLCAQFHIKIIWFAVSELITWAAGMTYSQFSAASYIISLFDIHCYNELRLI